MAERAARQREALTRLGAEPVAKSILFGDLHVHSTFSSDAFMFSLPLFQGEGAHPPADACDFARFCSDLDFFSINDHAEGLTPAHWAETKQSIRQCNAVAGDPADPDLVAFLGYEWSQAGKTRQEHWGHRNVIFRELAEDRVPTRPIGSGGASGKSTAHLGRRPPLHETLAPLLRDPEAWRRHRDLLRLQAEIGAIPVCPEGVDTRALPADCREVAATPAALFEKLDQWGFDVLVIPHGTAWGINTPPGASYDKQLVGRHHDPEKQRLIEVYSGHGNSEEYRDWSAAIPGPDGGLLCPEPTPDYLPCCWQAGEIVRARCRDPRSAGCEERVAETRRRYLAAGMVGAGAVPNASTTDWKDCGHCRDCFEPAARYQPGNSVQYALALGNFAAAAGPRRFRLGLIGSSDNHSARAGPGYKEFARLQMTDARGARDESVQDWARLLFGREFERQASFFLTGGLVAVHSEGRDRDTIWQALLRREVYGTSGERILLWFDLLNAPGGPRPMGAEVALAEPPRFRVRAVGALVQEPGCPADAVHALGPERLERLCLGECHHPGDRRRRVTRIEVVRIRPQIRRGEPIGELVEDPWRRFACGPDLAGCVVEFEDPEFVVGAREHVYYVRAVQEATPAVNAAALRCEVGVDGECVRSNPCYGDWRTSADDDCLAPSEERAWSSPIFLAPAADAPWPAADAP